MTDFLILIKPDGVRRGLIGQIVSQFEERGYEIRDMAMLVPTEELLRQHYAEHVDKVFFPGIVEFMTSGRVAALRMYGDVTLAREMIGATDPRMANTTTIRGRWGNHTRQNLVHCSDSSESGAYEVELWFPLHVIDLTQ